MIFVFALAFLLLLIKAILDLTQENKRLSAMAGRLR